MSKRKRAEQDVDGLQEDIAYNEEDYNDGLPRDENGFVETGFSISFDDFDGFDGLSGDEDEDIGQQQDIQTVDSKKNRQKDQDDAPRGGPGSQVLPVAQYLPDDFDGEPTDGHEYLFLVRREAAAHPGIQVAEAFVRANMHDRATHHNISAPSPSRVSPHRPSEAWRDEYLNGFRLMRQTFSIQADPQAALSLVPAHYLPIPSAADESSWKSYIHGRRRKASIIKDAEANVEAHMSHDGDIDSSGASAASPVRTPVDDILSKSRPPIPAVLRALDQPTAIYLLAHFDDWLRERLDSQQVVIKPSTIFLPPAMRRKQAAAAKLEKSGTAPAPTNVPPLPDFKALLAPIESQWMFSLLSVTDSLLSSSDISTLRSLVRTCMEIADATYSEQETYKTRVDVSESQKQAWQEVIKSCWMVVAAVWEGWSQRDLWE